MVLCALFCFCFASIVLAMTHGLFLQQNYISFCFRHFLCKLQEKDDKEKIVQKLFISDCFSLLTHGCLHYEALPSLLSPPICIVYQELSATKAKEGERVR